MNSLISKVITEAAAGYQRGGATVLFSARPGPVDLAVAPARPVARPARAPKPRLEVELDWNTDSTLYAGFGDDPVGVFVATYTRLAVGTVVDLAVTLPDGRVFTTTGRVQWTQEPRDPNDETLPGLGIEFTQVAEHPSWNPPRPELVTPSMPPIRVLSIHPLGSEERNAIHAFGQVRPPNFYIE